MSDFSLLTNNWFGKAVLGTLALAFAPVLAVANPPIQTLLVLLALALGHQWDRFAVTRFSATLAEASPRRLLAAAERGDPWLVFAFAGMGRLAATGGPVRSAQRQLSEEIMARCEFSRRARHEALSWFNAGTRLACPMSELAQRCSAITSVNGEALVLECLGRMAATRDGPEMNEMLRGLGSLLQFRRSDRPAPQAPDPAQQQLLEDAELLDVAVDDCSDAIKLAYRRGVARFHPDRLPVTATPAELALSERRMSRYREAYERLLAAGADKRFIQPRTVRSTKPPPARND
ncbi:MAG: DnaJ family molecular chaperone [Pseudomonadales bacterium]